MVDDLAAATEFFVELGLVLRVEWSAEGRWVDRIVGLEGVRADAAMMQTPNGKCRVLQPVFRRNTVVAASP